MEGKMKTPLEITFSIISNTYIETYADFYYSIQSVWYLLHITLHMNNHKLGFRNKSLADIFKFKHIYDL